MTPSSRKRDRKTLAIFSSASFLHDMGADMVFAVWPLFLTNVLGASMSVVGFVDGLGDAVVSLSQAAAGYWSDKIHKRKPFIWGGYALGALARIGYALSNTWQMVIPFRILDRAGKMRGSPRDAILSELSSDANRGKNFGILRASDNLGAVTGIVLALVLLPLLGFRTLFVLAACPSLLAAFLIVRYVKEKSVPKAQALKHVRFKLSRKAKIFFVATAFGELGVFSYSFLLLAARSLGWNDLSVPALYLVFNVVAAGLSYPLGALSDSLSRRAVLWFSYACWLLCCTLFLIDHSQLVIVLALILYGVYRAGTDTVQKAMMAELAPKEALATTLGAYQLLIGLCALPSSFVAGLLWDNYGMQSSFLWSSVLVVIAATLLLFIRQKRIS